MKIKRITALGCAAAMVSVLLLVGCQKKEIEKVDHGVIRIAYNNAEDYPHFKALKLGLRRNREGDGWEVYGKDLFEREHWGIRGRPSN